MTVDEAIARIRAVEGRRGALEMIQLGVARAMRYQAGRAQWFLEVHHECERMLERNSLELDEAKMALDMAHSDTQRSMAKERARNPFAGL